MTTAADFVDLSVEDVIGQIARSHSPGAHIQVTGPVGSGKTMVAGALRRQHDAVFIEPPDLAETDAVAHALLQAARQADVAVDGRSSIHTNVSAIAEHLAAALRPVVLRLPASWWLDRRPRFGDEQRLLAAARDFVETWFGCPQLQVVLIADRPYGMPRCDRILRLNPSEARRDMLQEESLWGSYASPARELLRAMNGGWNRPPAVTLRLAVGLVALGEPPAQAAQRIFANESMGDLVAAVVRRAAGATLVPSLMRFTRIRVPVPPAWVRDVVAPPDEHLPLFTACLGYGEAEIKISSGARTTLHGKLAPYLRHDSEGECVHEALADRHESVDGVHDPAQVGAEGIVHWLEKVHHLAHGGDRCAERWSRQVIEHRDQLCDRARVLSRTHRRYREAAGLYQRIIDQIDEKDAYAWHYLGFNLDRAASDRDRAEAAFTRAVELDPGNPWWNSRKITFLVGLGRIGDADRAWDDAVDAIDPEGDATHIDPDLPLNLHRHVVQAWLDHGEVKRAQRVLDRIVPPGTEHREIQDLAHSVRDAEEALTLGASVRPPGMPSAERFCRSVLLEQDDAGEPLRCWFAGRVESADQRGVHLVFATTEDEPTRRRLLRKYMPLEEWRTASRINPGLAKGMFIEIGEYGDRVLIERVASFGAPGWVAPDTRYLDRWSEG